MAKMEEHPFVGPASAKWKTVPWTEAYDRMHAAPIMEGGVPAVCPECGQHIGAAQGYKTKEAADFYVAKSRDEETHPPAFCAKMKAARAAQAQAQPQEKKKP